MPARFDQQAAQHAELSYFAARLYPLCLNFESDGDDRQTEDTVDA